MFECVQICTVSDTPHTLQRSPPVRSSRRGMSGIECRSVQRVQRPGGGLPWYFPRPGSGTVCAAACRVQSVRVRWSGQELTGGVYSRRPAPPGQPFNHRKNKKGSKNTPTSISSSKNFPQKQKDPYKGSAFCAILALQALKGRNLQWLKVK